MNNWNLFLPQMEIHYTIPLQVDCNLPLKPTYSDEPNILQALAHTPMEHLDKLRIYLGLTRMLRYQLPAEIQKVFVLNYLYTIQICYTETRTRFC